MKYSVFVFFSIASIFLLPLFSFGQNNDATFPHSWEGKWIGTLEVFKDTGKVQELPMELHIFPIDTVTQPTWTWTIIYGEDKEKGKRPYELVQLDAKKGHYVIDEKNTIKMEGYYLGNAFYQWFEVQGTRLLTRTEKMAKQLVWEIIVSNDQPVSTTGDSIFEGEEIPAVLAFHVETVQRAVLEKVE